MSSQSANAAQRILRLLEQVNRRCGRWCDEILKDFVTIWTATLLMEPAHRHAIATTGRMAQDDADTAEIFKVMRDKYRDEGIDACAECFAILRLEATEGFDDVLGQVYMLIRSTGKGQILGQYFTPDAVAKCMAQMTAHDLVPDLHDRLRTAGLAIGLDAKDCEALANGYEREDEASCRTWEGMFEQAIPHLKPLTVCEPCCGSGALILAMATAFPRWAIHAGLVVFTAVDLDHVCAKICHLNLLLHNITGTVIRGNTLTLKDMKTIGWSPAELHVRNLTKAHQECKVA